MHHFQNRLPCGQYQIVLFPEHLQVAAGKGSVIWEVKRKRKRREGKKEEKRKEEKEKKKKKKRERICQQLLLSFSSVVEGQ